MTPFIQWKKQAEDAWKSICRQALSGPGISPQGTNYAGKGELHGNNPAFDANHENPKDFQDAKNLSIFAHNEKLNQFMNLKGEDKMQDVKDLLGKNPYIGKDLLANNPYIGMSNGKDIADINKRNFIKKGILGLAAVIGIAAFSKAARAAFGGFIKFPDATTQVTAAATAAPTVKISCTYEDLARYVTSLSGGGANTIDSQGNLLNTSATATSGSRTLFIFSENTTINSVGSPTVSAIFSWVTSGTDFDCIFCLGRPDPTGGAITFTVAHYGFKITRRTSGTISLFATQADGTTETASAALATVAANDIVEVLFVINGTTSADYYWRLNGGARSAATNLATNLSTAVYGLNLQVTNAGVASQSQVQGQSMAYER